MCLRTQKCSTINYVDERFYYYYRQFEHYRTLPNKRLRLCVIKLKSEISHHHRSQLLFLLLLNISLVKLVSFCFHIIEQFVVEYFFYIMLDEIRGWWFEYFYLFNILTRKVIFIHIIKILTLVNWNWSSFEGFFLSVFFSQSQIIPRNRTWTIIMMMAFIFMENHLLFGLFQLIYSY